MLLEYLNGLPSNDSDSDFDGHVSDDHQREPDDEDTGASSSGNALQPLRQPDITTSGPLLSNPGDNKIYTKTFASNDV